MVKKRGKEKKKHIIPYERVFPQFYGEAADEEWESKEKESKRPIERRKKPKKSFRWR